MEVFGFKTDDDWTAPFPDDSPRFGMKLRLLGGDVVIPRGPKTLRPGVDPAKKPDWFNAIPARVTHFRLPFPCLPYFAIGIGRWGMYIGAKTYGFDRHEYRDYPGISPTDVYDGSRALVPTFRMSRKRPVKEPQ